MYQYRIIDTATAEELGILGFDPECGFSIAGYHGTSAQKALIAMAEDLNDLEHFHITVENGFSGSVSQVFTRKDADLPANLPKLIMQRFLLTADPVFPETGKNP